MFYHDSYLFYQKVKMIPESIRTFWYKGSAENKETNKNRKRAISLKNNSPDSKAEFWKETISYIWRSILFRYEIII